MSNSFICPGINLVVVRDILHGVDANIPEPDYIMQYWNKEIFVATDVLNVNKEPNIQSKILRQLTRSQGFKSARDTVNDELVYGIRHWYAVDDNGLVSGSLVVESSVDNELIEHRGEVRVAISEGTNLRGASAGDLINPKILASMRLLNFGDTFNYDKILIQKNGFFGIN